MDATPYLVEIGRRLEEVGLEAVLIGNAAAALQGAPVTTVDFDFMFCETPRNLQNRRKTLAALARESDRALRDMIRRWQALPPARRTNSRRRRA